MEFDFGILLIKADQRGQRQAQFAAHEQACTECLFKLGDLATDRRRLYTELTCRTHEAQVLCGRLEHIDRSQRRQDLMFHLIKLKRAQNSDFTTS